MTTALVVVVLAQAAFAAGWIAVSGQPGSTINLLVALAALAMGVQSGAILSLDVKGVFTTAATATLMFFSRELAQDSSIRERARHGGVLVALLAGATAGGLLLEHARTFAALLPLGVTVLVVAIAYDPCGHAKSRSTARATRSSISAGSSSRAEMACAAPPDA